MYASALHDACMSGRPNGVSDSTSPYGEFGSTLPAACMSGRPNGVPDSSAPMAGLMSVYNFGRNFDFSPVIKSETLLCPIFCQVLMRRMLYPEILHKIMP